MSKEFTGWAFMIVSIAAYGAFDSEIDSIAAIYWSSVGYIFSVLLLVNKPRLKPRLKTCGSCGHEVSETDKQCPNCKDYL